MMTTNDLEMASRRVRATRNSGNVNLGRRRALSALLGAGAFLGTSRAFADSGSSCFIAGTQVLLADGTERAIETIEIGDRLVGRGGTINRVVALDHTILCDRFLYSLNGGSHFVTAEHPFMTTDGWKSINPAATREENANLDVAPFSVGDRVLKGGFSEGDMPIADGATLLVPEPVYVEQVEEIVSIEPIEGEFELPLYNFFLDGDHTYHADGYLVHNKDGGGDGGGGGGGGGGDGGDGGGDGGDGGGGSGGSGGDGGGGSGGDGGGDGGGGSGGDGGGHGGDSDGGGHGGDSDGGGHGGDSDGGGHGGDDGGGHGGDDGGSHGGDDGGSHGGDDGGNSGSGSGNSGSGSSNSGSDSDNSGPGSANSGSSSDSDGDDGGESDDSGNDSSSDSDSDSGESDDSGNDSSSDSASGSDDSNSSSGDDSSAGGGGGDGSGAGGVGL